MDEKALKILEERIARYKCLSAAESELSTALSILSPRPEHSSFSGDAGRVRTVIGMMIYFPSDHEGFEFKAFVGLKGWELSKALSEILEKYRAKIRAEMAEL